MNLQQSIFDEQMKAFGLECFSCNCLLIDGKKKKCCKKYKKGKRCKSCPNG
jgi:hypothetical protein